MKTSELKTKLVNFNISFETLKDCTTEVILTVFNEADDKLCESYGNHNLITLYTELGFRGQNVSKKYNYK